MFLGSKSFHLYPKTNAARMCSSWRCTHLEIPLSGGKIVDSGVEADHFHVQTQFTLHRHFCSDLPFPPQVITSVFLRSKETFVVLQCSRLLIPMAESSIEWLACKGWFAKQLSSLSKTHAKIQLFHHCTVPNYVSDYNSKGTVYLPKDTSIPWVQWTTLSCLIWYCNWCVIFSLQVPGLAFQPNGNRIEIFTLRRKISIYCRSCLCIFFKRIDDLPLLHVTFK